MEDSTLAHMLYSNPVTSPLFKGVFILDELSHRMHSIAQPFSCVINIITQSQIRQGSLGHFVAFAVIDKVAYFLDSTGNSYTHYGDAVSNFVLHFHYPIICIQNRYQQHKSCSCALFALYFLYSLSKHHSLSHALSFLSVSDLQFNDFFVLNFVIQHYNINLSHRDIRLLMLCSS